MSNVGKRLKESYSKVDPEQRLALEEALALITELPKAKFDETLDVAIGLGVDSRKAEENIRGVVALPHGTGKKLRVAVFCKGELVKQAEEAGADFAGSDELIQKVQEGWTGFEAAVASPDMMASVGKIGKILGPRGLMPNPKLGTVTKDVAQAVTAIKSGRVEYRVEKTGIVHVGVGKVSFGKDKLKENVETLVDALVKAKPSTAKGIYLKRMHLATTMGPGVSIDVLPYR